MNPVRDRGRVRRLLTKHGTMTNPNNNTRQAPRPISNGKGMRHVEHSAIYGGLISQRLRPFSKQVTRIRISFHVPGAQAKNPLLLPLCADMLRRGSRRFSKIAHEELLASLGVSLDIVGGGEFVHVSLTSRSAVLKDVLVLLADTLQRPRFLPAELQKLKRETEQALHESKQDTKYLVRALFSRLIYPKGDHRRTPTLEEQKRYLRHITTASLADTHRMLRESECFLSVSGSEDAYELTRSLLRRLGKSAHAKAPNALTPITHQHVPAVVDFVPEKQNVELLIGGAVSLTPGTEEYTAFALGVDILGKRGGFAGRLMSTVREKEGLTYGIYSWLSGQHRNYPGHFVIGTFFTPKDLEQGIRSTFRELRMIVERGVTEAEVARFKRLLINQYTLLFESGESTLEAYHGAVLAGFDHTHIEQYAERITAVTTQMVSQAMRAHLTPEKFVIAASGSLRKLPYTAATVPNGPAVQK